MSMSPFSFSVVVYRGYNKDTGESNYHCQQGMGFADSFAQAAGNVENYYGSDLISIQKLELFEESNLILMPQACINEYKRREDGANYEDVSKPCNVEGHLFCEMSQEASKNEC